MLEDTKYMLIVMLNIVTSCMAQLRLELELSQFGAC